VEDLGGSGTTGIGNESSAVTGRKCPAGPTVSGIDVSSWQGGVNWGAVAASGQKFAVARVSDGSYIDSQFAANWSGMKSAGLIRGAYQFFEPAQDAVAQANLVIARVGRLGAGDLPVMLDMEVTGGQSAATITAKIHQWVGAITAGTGKTPYIYTGAYFWDDSVKSADFAGLALNVAWYGTDCPGTPNAWGGWTFHQYSSSGSVSGVSGHVDMDVFNGPLSALQAFANGGGSGGGGGKVSSVNEVAFQANTGDLWTVGSAGNTDWHLGMFPGTSPSIAGLAGGGFQAAFEANTGNLWTVGSAGMRDWSLGMMHGTNPAITAVGDGFEVAFQANTASLWTVGSAGNTDWHLGLSSTTSPAIVGLESGGFQVAFQANTGNLWTVGNAGNRDWGLGMMKDTSPTLQNPSGSDFRVYFQANTGSLWQAGPGGVGAMNLGLFGGSSPSGT
jgi:GH25 family lysozyme M1 (1,4-beta-N-acetylmuramidase)